MMKKYGVALLALLLFSCSDPEERFDTGYSDGYAAGYNTECKIRTTLIEGAWDDEEYSRGYRAGDVDGRKACRDKRRD